MWQFIERYRHVSLLVAVLVIQLFLLAYQIKRENDVRLIRVWAIAVFTPVEKGLDAAGDGLASVWQDYVALYGARQESQQLRQQLDQARLEMQRLETRAGEAERLAALLGLRAANPEAPLVAAEVIGTSPAASTRTVLLNRGRRAGLERNMVVLTPEGVVGRIIQVLEDSAQVLLVTDAESGVGAVVEDSRLVGVVKGTGGSRLALDYIPNDQSVPVGARLVTSGQDQLFPPLPAAGGAPVFPKGLPLGTVEAARPGEVFQEITVRPAAALNRLEHVFVLGVTVDMLERAERRSQSGPAPPAAPPAEPRVER